MSSKKSTVASVREDGTEPRQATFSEYGAGGRFFTLADLGALPAPHDPSRDPLTEFRPSQLAMSISDAVLLCD